MQQKMMKTALFVDDEEMIHEIVIGLMERWGFTVIPAMNGIDAVRLYERQKDRIGLVILDMVLDDISGEEVYDRIKTINPDVKVLVMSGKGVDAKIRKILTNGMNGYIQKPFNIRYFQEKLNEMVSISVVAGP
jgi:two-component system, cell cycle sensor histidine kinase and response regulator CckA